MAPIAHFLNPWIFFEGWVLPGLLWAINSFFLHLPHWVKALYIATLNTQVDGQQPASPDTGFLINGNTTISAAATTQPVEFTPLCYLYLCLPGLHSHSLNGIKRQHRFNWKLKTARSPAVQITKTLLQHWQIISHSSGRRIQVLKFVREVSFPSPTTPMTDFHPKKFPSSFT